MVADLGGVTKAANQLFITQSALSKFLRNKEKEMGTPLFSRIGKRFIPTYAGEKCIEAARKILAINKQLDDDVNQIAKEGKGRIRIAFHSSWSDFFFMTIYPIFQSRYPDTDLQIFEINSNEALKKMDKGELDFAVITASWKTHSKFACNVLRTQHFVLAVKEGHPLLEKTEILSKYPYPHIDLNELQGVPLILRHTAQKTRVYTTDLFNNIDFEPRVALETQSRENALRAAEYGIGVTFTLDDPTMLLTHKNIRFISYDEPNPDTFINIIYNKGHTFTNSENDLIKFITEQYRLLP